MQDLIRAFACRDLQAKAAQSLAWLCCTCLFTEIAVSWQWVCGRTPLLLQVFAQQTMLGMVWREVHEAQGCGQNCLAFVCDLPASAMYLAQQKLFCMRICLVWPVSPFLRQYIKQSENWDFQQAIVHAMKPTSSFWHKLSRILHSKSVTGNFWSSSKMTLLTEEAWAQNSLPVYINSG